MLYVPMSSLPTKLIIAIRRIAAFQNPEFYHAQAKRISIYDKPSIIHYADLFIENIGLPRGCEDHIFELLKHYKIKVNVIDK